MNLLRQLNARPRVRICAPGNTAAVVAAALWRLGAEADCALPMYVYDIDPALPAYDLGVAYRWRERLPEALLENLPVVNLHMSMLPHCRGAHPLYHAVRLGLPVGCTVHWMDGEIDAGAVIAQQLLAPSGAETMRELYDRAEALLFELLRLAWPEILALKPGQRQTGPATFHRATELPALGPKGWDVSVDDVRAMGGLPPMSEDAGFVGSADPEDGRR